MLYFIIINIFFLIMGAGLLYFHRRTKNVDMSDDISRSVSKKIIGKNIKASENQADEIFIVNLKLKVPQETNEVDDLDIVFLLDASGSMGNGANSALQLAINALKSFTQSLPSSVHYGLVIFDHRIVREVPISKHSDVKKYLESASAKGGTAIHSALHHGSILLNEGRSDVKKALILLSDGYSDEALSYKESDSIKNKNTNTVIYSIGLGSAKQSLLRNISSGDNYYFYVKEANDLKNTFKDLGQRVFETAVHCQLEENIPANYFDYYQLSMGDYPEVNTEIVPIDITENREEKIITVKWSFPVSKNIDGNGEVDIWYGLKPNCLGFFPLVCENKPNQGEVRWKMPNGSNIAPISLKGGPYGLVVRKAFISDGGVKEWLLKAFFSLWYALYKPICKSDVVRLVNNYYEITSPKRIPSFKLEKEYKIYRPKLRPALVIGLGSYGESALISFNSYLEERYISTSQLSLLSIKDLYQHSDNVALSDNIHQLNVYANSRAYLEQRRYQYNKSKPWLPINNLLAGNESSNRVFDDRRKARLALMLNPKEIEKVIVDYINEISVSEGNIIILLDSAESFANGILLEVAHICATHTDGLMSINTIMARRNNPTNKRQVDGFIREILRVTTLRNEIIFSDRGLDDIALAKAGNKNDSGAKNLLDRLIVYEEEASQTESESLDNLGHFIGQYLSAKEVEKGFANTKGTYCSELKIPYQCGLPQKSIWYQVKEKIYRNYFLERKFALVIETEKYYQNKVESLRNLFWSFKSNEASSDNKSSNVRLLIELGELVKSHKISDYLMRLDYSSFWKVDVPEYRLFDIKNHHEQFMRYYLSWWLTEILKDLSKKEQQIGKSLYIISRTLDDITKDFRQLIAENNKRKSSHELRFSKVSNDFGEILRISLESINTINSAVNEGYKYLVSIQGSSNKLSQSTSFETKNKDDSMLSLVEQRYQAWCVEHSEKFLNSIQLRVSKNDELDTPKIVLDCLGEELDLSQANTVKDFVIKSLQNYEMFVLSDVDKEWLKPKSVKLPNRTGGYHNYVVGLLGNSYKDLKNKNTEDESALLFYSQKKSKLEQVFAIDKNSDADYCWSEEYNAALLARTMESQLDKKSNFQGNYQIVSLCRELEALQYFFHALKERNIYVKNNKVLWRFDDGSYHLAMSINGYTTDDFYQIARRAVLIRRDAVDQSRLIPVLQQSLKIDVTDMESYLDGINQHELVRACCIDKLWSQWDSFMRAVVLHIKNSSV